MKGRLIVFGLPLCFFLFSSCATAPKTFVDWRTAPPLADGFGRIWIYWPGNAWGHRDEIAIHVNYATAGTIQRGTAFYIDRPPGNYLVEATWIGRTKRHTTLDSGKILFVRMTRVSALADAYVLQEVDESEALGLKQLERCLLANTSAPLPVANNAYETRLIFNLTEPDASKVTGALAELERNFPDDRNAWAQIKPLLRDSRPKVRRKAARVLGVVRADVDQDNIDAICEMLDSSEPGEQIDALKSLRGLKSSVAVPRIIPLLKSTHPGVIRDACRTLSVLADKNAIHSIHPLLQHPDIAVKQDAEDAIFLLERKPPDERVVKKAI